MLRFLPNALTIARMLSAVPLAYWLWKGQIGAALALLVVAGVTDLLDGFLAREFGWRTATGAWLDPTADKVLITTSLITLTIKGMIPLWFCLLVIGRDVGLAVGALALVLSGVKVAMRPFLSGKLATMVQNIAILLVILRQIWPTLALVLLYIFVLAALVTIVSAFSYGRAWKRLYATRSTSSSLIE